MKPVILLIFFATACFIACSPKLGDQQVQNSAQPIPLNYAKDAYVVSDEGIVISGREEIQLQRRSESLSIRNYQIDTSIIARSQRGIKYELGDSEYSNDEKRKHLFIYETIDSVSQIVFEFSARHAPYTNELSAIDERRKQWIKLCNQHSAANLINDLYSENTLYYNHRPMVEGRSDLIPVYSYMNRESYSLTLHPIIVEQVNDRFVFEIGQCEGSYGGKYILIWRKDNDGQWRIFIDSNV